jgi:hypothetical protein
MRSLASIGRINGGQSVRRFNARRRTFGDSPSAAARGVRRGENSAQFQNCVPEQDERRIERDASASRIQEPFKLKPFWDTN